jgi:hypothetical protein
MYMLALLIAGGLRWLLIGLALLLAWYILAPLFTPGRLKKRPGSKAGSKRPRSKRGLTVIDGKGRIIDD